MREEKKAKKLSDGSSVEIEALYVSASTRVEELPLKQPTVEYRSFSNEVVKNVERPQ